MARLPFTVVVALVLVTLTGCGPSHSTGSTGEGHVYSTVTHGGRLTVRWHGSVALTDDGLDVASLGPGGSLTITEGTWLRRMFIGGSRTLVLRTGADGTIAREFRRSGEDRPFAPEGAEWLAGVLPRLLDGGFAAEARVSQLLRTSGVDGVLRAIPSLRSDYLQARYLTHLLDQDMLPESALGPALAVAGQEIASDYEMSQLLRSVAGHHGVDRARAPFFAAAATIGSDYERARVLGTVLQAGRPPDETVIALLESAAAIGSDHELAGVLVQLAAQGPLGTEAHERYLATVRGLGSDHQRNRALAALVNPPPATQTELRP